MEMFLAILSYRQVMPAFLDFAFCFGGQEHAEDFHFSGFRHETSLCITDRRLRVPELDRSGRSLQMCYSLRSVESSPGEKVPWSIRQMAVYHSFDIESGQACWIIIKGNNGMRDRVEKETITANGSDLRSFQSVPHSYSATLETHLLFCEWSAENWRWYINLLEEKVQDITRRTLDKAIEANPYSTGERTDGSSHDTIPKSPLKRADTFIGSLAKALTFDRSSSRKETKSIPIPTVPNPTPSGRRAPPVLPPDVSEQKVKAKSKSEGFQFEEVRRIQLIEERANEALLVLRTNANVQDELKLYHCSLASRPDFPHDIKQHCEKNLARFENRINNLQNYFRMQQSRLENATSASSRSKKPYYMVYWTIRTCSSVKEWQRKASIRQIRWKK